MVVPSKTVHVVDTPPGYPAVVTVTGSGGWSRDWGVDMTGHHSITFPPRGTGRTPFDSLESADLNGIRPVGRDERLRQRWPAKITCFWGVTQPATIPSFFHPVARDVRR